MTRFLPPAPVLLAALDADVVGNRGARKHDDFVAFGDAGGHRTEVRIGLGHLHCRKLRPASDDLVERPTAALPEQRTERHADGVLRFAYDDTNIDAEI